MYFSLSQHDNTFIRSQKSSLVLAVPLCARTIIFFCDDLTFYHYSLIENKILYQSKLPGRVIQAISLSGHQILCTIFEARALMLLNIEQRSFQQICKLPQTRIHNQSKQRDIFTQIRLNIFERSNRFYIQQPKIQENKTKIYFYDNQAMQNKEKIKIQQFKIKQIYTRKMVLKKLDTQKRLVLFKQDIDENGTFKFTTIDCVKDFMQAEHACVHQAFSRFATVRQIKSISAEDQNSKILIFVNSSSPEILVFVNNEVLDYAYKSKKVFYETVLVNIKLGYAMFKFMPDPEQLNPNYDHVLQLINIKNGELLQRKKLTIHQLVKSWEDDYILMYRKQTSPTLSSIFRTQNIINKKAFYMKILNERGFNDFSQRFLGQILNTFQ